MCLAMKKLLGEFKAFIMRGNVIELAVAVVIGAAFTALVTSATNNLINPVLGMLLAGKGMDVLNFKFLYVGNFIMAVINFVITAAVVFFLFVKPLNRLSALFGKKDDTGAPPATLADVVAELKAVREELRIARGEQPTPPPTPTLPPPPPAA
jgi:large conductance mechanosensitive channel